MKIPAKSEKRPNNGKGYGHTLSSDWLLLLVTVTAMAPAEGTCKGSTVWTQGSDQ